jgi:N6-L-threonylcarbamoyladenine synthase
VTGQAQATILGIETSCDETAAAVVVREQSGRSVIRSNVVRSQLDEHAAFGGVVPELAARAHVTYLDHIIAQACREAGIGLDEVDAIAATAGPGLIGGVLVGLTTGKALAAALDKPFLAINHLEAHALTARMTDGVQFPYLMLLVSGGHSQFVLVRGVGDYERWGTTIDDALGEAFDKVAKLLSLGHPGGPAVERTALGGDPRRFRFPRPLLREATELPGAAPVLVVAGGVAANRTIATALGAVCAKAGAQLVVPPMALCTDNGAMVAWAGAERFVLGVRDGLDAVARPRWPLDLPDMKVAPHAA